MTKTCLIKKNERRKELVARYASRRAALLLILRNPATEPDDRLKAYAKLRKLPRDVSPTRVRNRCMLTGRPRANYRKFGISRIRFRELALIGEIPGVRKASW